ncbi:MAG: 1,4-alpha-glucan branching protein GlgB [Clostridium sp.]|nr:1,4-alpha-glucan branching protein GlgB [Clostridium sp.]MCI7441793.1 1,4-alpha-glucan branching protein GlgB [Clostridium sp.]
MTEIKKDKVIENLNTDKLKETVENKEIETSLKEEKPKKTRIRKKKEEKDLVDEKIEESEKKNTKPRTIRKKEVVKDDEIDIKEEVTIKEEVLKEEKVVKQKRNVKSKKEKKADDSENELSKSVQVKEDSAVDKDEVKETKPPKKTRAKKKSTTEEKEIIVEEQKEVTEAKVENKEKTEIKEVEDKKATKKRTTTTSKKTTTAKKVSYTNFYDGKEYEAQEIFGSHFVTEKGVKGVKFTVWAPNAKEIWLVCDSNEFKIDNNYKLKKVSKKGIWSIFIPNMEAGEKYKYAIMSPWDNVVYKADPYARCSEVRPNTASIVYKPEKFTWEDRNWIAKRKRRNLFTTPMNIYEIHLGSWKRKEDGSFYTYDELADMLPEYVEEMGYTHVEFMPLVEYPLDASWGYQGVGYFSLTSRYGTIEGFKKLVNEFHKRDIGIILDWVPGHFCRDAHGLYMFDGTPTYEYQDAWKADNKGWGTSNFDLGKPEVKSFLISSAMYWIKEFHIDGIRMDAVSNMLYLDYDRRPGEWVPNIYGDHGNLEGIEFLKEINKVIDESNTNVMMIAEESTAWKNVTKHDGEDSLGFDFKWNMGWMNDTLEYVKLDPIYRKYHHNNITFSIHYNYTENFILPISHDEVVHGKGSLIAKMYGDNWNKYAGLRLYLTYMIGHPGKKLLFMGTEFGQFTEWKESEQVSWNVIEKYPIHKQIHNFTKELNKFYLDNKSLWELDYDRKGFTWIDGGNTEQSIFSFVRNGKKPGDMLLFICNFTPMVYYDFKVGVPYEGAYVEVFNSDDERFGGSGQIMGDVVLFSEKVKKEVVETSEINNEVVDKVGNEALDEVATEKVVEEEPLFNGQKQTINVKVPPMAVLVIGLKK